MELNPKSKRFEIEPDIFISDSGHAWSAKLNPELAEDCEAFYSEKTINELIEKIRSLEGALDICKRYTQGEYLDPADLAADYGGLGYEKHPAVVSVGNQCLEIARLKKLSVEHIMLDIVPGVEGQGVEIYATSVDEVEEKLSEMGEALEEWVLGIRSNFIYAGETRHVCGSGPNDVGVKWCGGIARDGIALYRLKSSVF